MKKILKTIVDLMYLSPLKLKKFKQNYPSDTVLAYGACKGICKNESTVVERGTDWLASQRGMFILTDKRVVMSKWMIPLENIEKSDVLMYRSGMVLKISSSNDLHHQFGLQYNQALLKQESLPLKMIKEKVTYSFFSKFIRVFIIFMFLNIVLRLIIK